MDLTAPEGLYVYVIYVMLIVNFHWQVRLISRCWWMLMSQVSKVQCLTSLRWCSVVPCRAFHSWSRATVRHRWQHQSQLSVPLRSTCAHCHAARLVIICSMMKRLLPAGLLTIPTSTLCMCFILCDQLCWIGIVVLGSQFQGFGIFNPWFAISSNEFEWSYVSTLGFG